jgi:hypothetical protein
MAATGIGSWRLTYRQAVVDVMPVIGRSVGRIDAECFYGVDRLKHFLDLPPTRQVQQALATGAYMRNGREGFARRDRSQNVDARQDGSVVVGRPADERIDGARRKRNNTPPAVEDALLCGSAEADPVLDSAFDPLKLDVREFSHGIRL